MSDEVIKRPESSIELTRSIVKKIHSPIQDSVHVFGFLSSGRRLNKDGHYDHSDGGTY